MKWGFLLFVGLSVFVGGCGKKGPSVDVAAVAKVAMAKYPGRYFAPWDGSEGVVQMNAQLAQLKVPEVEIEEREEERTFLVTVKFKSTSSGTIAPKVFVSAYDRKGQEIGRWPVVEHTLSDLRSGESDETADRITLKKDVEPVLISVDDGVRPAATVAAAGPEAVMPKPAGPRAGSTSPSGDGSVRGNWVTAVGRLDAGVTVYWRDTPTSDTATPWFTIINPYIEGDDGPLMYVRYAATGSEELKDRRAVMRSQAALDGYLVVPAR